LKPVKGKRERHENVRSSQQRDGQPAGLGQVMEFKLQFKPFVPVGTELDFGNSKVFVSVVGLVPSIRIIIEGMVV
jgi:hypothetical protein